MMERTTAVSIRSLTETHATVAGYGVVFGGVDLYGESFTPETDFMLDLVPRKPVLYDHGLGDVKHFLGSVKSVAVDAYGLWVEAELERSSAYVAQVLELAEKGALGWSSGTAGHLARREGSVIKSWPIVEMSLTPTPAEARTLGVEVLKSLTECDAAFEALLPKGDAATSPAGADGVADSEVKQAVTEGAKPEEREMDTEVKAVAEAPAEEKADVGALVAEVKALRAALEKEPAVNAPALNLKSKRGDSEVKAIAYYIRTGDEGALKASNDTDMNIGTAADGGVAVPTGHYQGIIARRDEEMLATKLGVMRIPGKGLTVNVPYDNEDDGEFVAKGEAAAFDRDAPALDRHQMTLAKYTKSVEISTELLEDEDSNLMAFLNGFIGRGIAKTHNSLLLNELRTNGTAALTLASGTAIAADEIPALIYKLPGEYADNAAWVMARATEGMIRSLAGDAFQFAPMPGGQIGQRPELFGYPVYNSAYASAVGLSAKSLIFGNFSYVGMRDGAISFLRNPYLKGNSGQVVLHYSFRTVYKVLQPEAIVYATQKAS